MSACDFNKKTGLPSEVQEQDDFGSHGLAAELDSASTSRVGFQTGPKEKYKLTTSMSWRSSDQKKIGSETGPDLYKLSVNNWAPNWARVKSK